MANEITVRATMSMTYGLVRRSVDSENFVCDAAAAVGEGPKTLLLTTTQAALSKGSITTAKWLWLLNTHATVAALVSMDNNTSYPISVPANGGCALIPLASGLDITHVLIKSASATGSIEYAILP